MANYASRWIPRFSDLARDLWRQTHADVVFVSDETQLKRLVTKKNAMVKDEGFFDNAWKTTLTADAGPVGLSGILSQESP